MIDIFLQHQMDFTNRALGLVDWGDELIHSTGKPQIYLDLFWIDQYSGILTREVFQICQ